MLFHAARCWAGKTPRVAHDSTPTVPRTTGGSQSEALAWRPSTGRSPRLDSRAPEWSRWSDLFAADSDPFVRLLHAALDAGALIAAQDERGRGTPNPLSLARMAVAMDEGPGRTMNP